MGILSAIPGVLALLVLVGLLVWVITATRGRLRTLGAVGIVLQLGSLLVGVSFGIGAPALIRAFNLPVTAVALMINSVTTLLAVVGVVLLVVALVTASRSSAR